MGMRHVSGVKMSLIYLGMLDERGYSFLTECGVLWVIEGDRDLLLGKNIGGLYRLVGSVVTGGTAVRHGTNRIGYSVGQEMRRRHVQGVGRVAKICGGFRPEGRKAIGARCPREGP